MVETNKAFGFEKVDVDNIDHQQAVLSLMNDYMLDDMGLNSPLSKELGAQIIDGLKVQENYLGFLTQYNGSYISLANCFVGFSTFKAKQLINIHDFIVSPEHRKLGVGKFMLENIAEYGVQHEFCKITLEVRYDNHGAQRLYKRLGFEECEPPMHFWQKTLSR